MDNLQKIDEKILRLKKRHEKVQTQQAISFMREAQKIFQDRFSPDMALGILPETWTTASETQKTEWKKRGRDFRPPLVQNNQERTQTPEATHQ